MIERWASVPGTRGQYEVSDRGRVRSLRSPGSPRIMKAQPSNGVGHLKLDLRLDGRRYPSWVHRLVMESFVGPCPAGQEVRHLDGNATNNVLTNLAYGTHLVNVRDTVIHGHHNEALKTHCVHGHEFSSENTYLHPSGQRVCRACQRRRDVERRSGRRQEYPSLRPVIETRVAELKEAE